MTFTILFTAGTILALFFVYFSWSSRNEAKRSQSTLARMKANPATVTEIRLHDNDPIIVEVCFYKEEFVRLSGIYGVEAVRMYDNLKAQFPSAHFSVFVNGSESQQS